MKHRTIGMALAFASALSLASSGPVLAESTWSAIKPAIFQERVIHHSRELISLDAPYRTLDDRVIPISVKYSVGGICWLLVLVYCSLGWRNRSKTGVSGQQVSKVHRSEP